MTQASQVFKLPTAPKVTHPETKASTRLVVVENARDLEDFLDVPSFVYWGDPYYVAPLRRSERELFDRAKNPFFKHGDARLWTAFHGHERPVARVAAFIDRSYDARAGKRWGFFGFIEFMNDARLPEALLAEACRWLRAQGVEEIAGPIAFSPSYGRQGAQVEGFDDAPVLTRSYSPTSYPGYLTRLGLEPWFDVHGYALDTTRPPDGALAAEAREVAARDGLTVRAIAADSREDWESIARIQEEAYRARPRSAPLPREEIVLQSLAAQRLLRLFPEGLLILERAGAPVGASCALPDYNRVLKPLGGSWFPLGWLRALLLERTIDRVHWTGPLVDASTAPDARAVLAHAALERLHRAGYRSAHVDAAADDPDRIALVAGLGAAKVRAWRIYKVPAGFPDAMQHTPARA